MDLFSSTSLKVQEILLKKRKILKIKKNLKNKEQYNLHSIQTENEPQCKIL